MPPIPLDLLIPLILLGVTFGIVLVMMGWRRRAGLRLSRAIERLERELGLERVTDRRRREAIGRCIASLMTGDALSVTHSALPLADALEYHTRAGSRITLVRVDDEGYWSGAPMAEEVAMLAVFFDALDVELPRFTLRPAHGLARVAHGPGLFPERTPFGANNLVHTREPDCIYHVFSPEVRTLLEGNDAVSIRAMPNYLMIYRNDRALGADALRVFVEDAVVLGRMICDNAREHRHETQRTQTS